MSNNFSLVSLYTYITNNIEKILAVRKETEEIQIGFNSSYVEWKAKHDATLERLSEAVTNRPGEVGSALQSRIEERTVEERRIIAERQQQLRDTLIPETQTKADEALREGRSLTEKLRELNPRLDEYEENLKAQRAAIEQELAQLNEQVRGLSRRFGVVMHFVKICKLDRKRHRLIGQLQAIQQRLKEVRQEWCGVQDQIQADQETLQTDWRELTLKLAGLQGELNYLDNEASREALALKRAARYLIDNFKEPISCPAEDLKRDLDSMVELNIQTDDYQNGLGSVAGLMSWLDGVAEGLREFGKSVDGLIKQQKMHSSYLPELHVSLPDEVLAFHQQWDGLREKVEADGHLCANPAEFVAAVQPVMERELNKEKIETMFDSLGGALKRATDRWKG